MEYSVIMSGFGGQGVLLMGDLLAYSAMKAGLEVTWMPSYGVEMRGGTARCTVVISDNKIGSPIAEEPFAVMAMNGPSLEKFQDYVAPGGLLMVNSSIVCEYVPPREDIEIVNVPTQDIATAGGNLKMANIAMLGAFLGKSELFTIDFIEECLKTFLPESRQKLLPVFSKTLRLGKEYTTIAQYQQAL